MRKWLKVLGAVTVLLVATAVVALGIWLFLGLRPMRVTVVGRVLNEQGQPLIGAEITAIPLPIHYTTIGLL